MIQKVDDVSRIEAIKRNSQSSNPAIGSHTDSSILDLQNRAKDRSGSKTIFNLRSPGAIVSAGKAKELNRSKMVAQAAVVSLPLSSTEVFRLPVAYRLMRQCLRYTARWKGSESLSEIMAADSSNPDPWTVPDPADKVAPFKGIVARQWIRGQLDMQSLPDYNCPHYIIETPVRRLQFVKALTYAPPEIPISAYDPETYDISEDYDPSIESHDPALHIWCRAMESVAEVLRIGAGLDEEERVRDQKGLYGLTDPAIVRALWPSANELILFERRMLEECQERFIDESRRGVMDYLAFNYGMGYDEGSQFLPLVERYFSQMWSDTDMEVKKSVHMLRLEDFIRRAKSHEDFARELAGLKEISAILGLKQNSSNADADWRQVGEDMEDYALTNGEIDYDSDVEMEPPERPDYID